MHQGQGKRVKCKSSKGIKETNYILPLRETPDGPSESSLTTIREDENERTTRVKN